MSDSASPKRRLSLFDSTCIIVGIIIGSGIYRTTPTIANFTLDQTQLAIAWILGGCIAVVGALCYAELTTTYPREGGDFQFLRQAYGPRTGFLFVWAEYWIVRPGNVGMMAFVAAQYMEAFWASVSKTTLTVEERTWFHVFAAGSSVLLLTGMNLLGVRSGKWTQNVLTVLKVLGLLAIFAAALMTPAAPAVIAKADSQWDGGFRVAMVLVLFTYGGWGEISYAAAEVRKPERNLWRALLLGVAVVTVVYLLMNIAFLRVLNFEGLRQSDAVAADALAPSLGSWAAAAMCVLVGVSCLGSINGMLFTGSRVYYALGNENRFFSWVGKWSAKRDAPVRSLALQSAITLAYIVYFGRDAQGFERLVYFSAPVFWFFGFMVAVALFILRFKDAKVKRTFKVPGYPWTPIVFCLCCAFLFESSFTYALNNRASEAWWAITIIFVGAILTPWLGAPAPKSDALQKRNGRTGQGSGE